MGSLGVLYKKTFQSNAEKEAVTFGDTTYTFAQLRDRAMRLANALLASKFKKGDRIAILASNRIEHLELDIAVAMTGLVKVPLNYRLHPKEHDYMLENSEANFLLAESDLVSGIETKVETIHFGEEYEKWIAEASNEDPNIEVDEDDTFAIMYTSGTTGRPKGAVQSHRNYISCALSLIMGSGMDETDVIGHVAPLTHGSVTMSHCSLILGLKQIIFNRFEPEAFLEAIESESISAVFLVPTMVNLMIHEQTFKDRDLSSLKTINMAGAPMAAEKIKQALDYLGPVIVETYGQVEAPLTITMMPRYELGNRLASCGKTGIFAEIKLVDEQGKEVESGKIGEVTCRGPLVMKGYWNNEEATVETIKNGWLYTGDLGWMDEDGYLHLVDRSKDVIISGGANIYPREVEEVLNLHPGVKETCVFGAESEKWGEAVVAYVVPIDGEQVEDEELLDVCENNLAGFKKPKHIEIVPSLPKSSYGKILRREAREIFVRENGKVLD